MSEKFNIGDKMKYEFTCPEEKRVRVIVNTDAKNEADDQFAIVHHLLTPKFDVKGLIAAHFENVWEKEYFAKVRNVPEKCSMDESYKEIEKVLDLMNLTEKYNIYRGATHALTDASLPVESEGARFIIDEAMKDDDRPLFVVFLGTITDMASAYLMEPKIVDRLTAVWIGGGAYPEGGDEFNLSQDITAANVIFNSEIPLWQVPVNAYQQIRVSLAELQVKVRPYGAIGKYLFDQMIRYNDEWGGCASFPQGESWCLGDQPTVTVVLEGHDNMFDWKVAPEISPDMKYIHGKDNRKIRVYHHIDSRFTLEDFFAKLIINYSE